MVDRIVDMAKISGQITEVVCGMATGVDRSGEHWANTHKIPVKKFPADWRNLGKSAGPIRNQQMGDYADAALIIWDGVSTGSYGMYQIMKKLGKPVFLLTVKLKIIEDGSSYPLIYYEMPNGERIREHA